MLLMNVLNKLTQWGFFKYNSTRQFNKACKQSLTIIENKKELKVIFASTDIYETECFFAFSFIIEGTLQKFFFNL
jgi:hypothetical protein